MSDKNNLEKRIKKLESDIETILLLTERMNARNSDIVQLADRVAQNSGISISQLIDISNWRVIK